MSDPVEFPRRYRAQADVEIAALLASSLAYGRVDLFRPRIEQVLRGMGTSPGDFTASLTPARARKLLGGFVYRFNLGADVGALLFGARAMLRQHGTLEGAFVAQRRADESWPTTLSRFTHALRQRGDSPALRAALGPPRALSHLLPHPVGTGASKRLNLFLRWLVRGPDAIDLGLWRRVSPAQLVIPLDTHVARISTWLGLTRRKTIDWKAAEDVTASLRQLDAGDPVRYDFALCHFGMSGACPVRPRAENCRRCPLRSVCLTGRRLARSNATRAA